MATEKKVLFNAFAQFFGKILSIGASLIIVKILTNIGKDFYGKYLTAYEFLAFFGILADAGLFAIAVREISKNSNKKLKSSTQKSPEFILGNIFSIRIFLIIIVTFLAGISAQFISSYDSDIKLGIWITAISMALTIVAGTLSSVLQARMKIHFFSAGLVLGKIILAILIFLIAQNKNIFENNLFFMMLCAGVISNIIFCAFVIFFTKKEIRISLRFNFDWWKKIFKISLPYGLALILQTLYLRIDVILISIILGASAVGTYGVATRIMESFLILGVFFGQAILPKISAEEKKEKKASQTLSWGVEKLLIFSIPIIICVLVFSPKIILVLSSNEFLSTSNFLGSDSILKILVPTVFFAYLNQLFTFSLVSKNRQNYLLIVNGIAVFINILLNVLFLKKFGIIVAAVSTIFCEIIVFGLLLYEIIKYFSLNFVFQNLIIIFTANFLLWAIVYFASFYDYFILAGGAGAIAYLSIFLYFKKKFLAVQ